MRRSPSQARNHKSPHFDRHLVIFCNICLPCFRVDGWPVTAPGYTGGWHLRKPVLHAHQSGITPPRRFTGRRIGAAPLPFASSRMAAHPWHNYNTMRQILIMTLCPIAIVSSCQKCPSFMICPLRVRSGLCRQPTNRNLPPVRPVSANSRASGRVPDSLATRDWIIATDEPSARSPAALPL